MKRKRFVVSAPPLVGPVYYPAEDGKVCESTKHYSQRADLYVALGSFFAAQPAVFVSANMFVYYQEGDPRIRFTPDVMVVWGVRPRPSKKWDNYRLWQEGVPPGVIIELTATSTRRADTVLKPKLYASLGVQEYYLFDPLGEFLMPRLQGYHLNAAGQYERLLGDEFDSPALGLRLLVRDEWLRLFNAATGTLLPTFEEQHAKLVALNAETAALNAEIAALNAETAAIRAETATLNARLAEIKAEGADIHSQKAVLAVTESENVGRRGKPAQ